MPLTCLSGKTLYLSFQETASIMAVPFRSSTFQPPRHGAISTLPTRAHDATDIRLMPSGMVIVLNRGLTSKYAPLAKTADLLASSEPGVGLGGDTIAIFSSGKDGQLVVEGHVELGCYQLREILDISVSKEAEAVLVSCNGRDGKHGGSRKVAFSRAGSRHRGDVYGSVVAAWDTGISFMGIAPLR